MILIQVFMVPQGTGPRRLLTQATLSCVGEATRDLPEAGVTKGSRAYRVVLHKDTAFGGPGEDADLRGARPWKTGTVVGHRPGPRGVWDLLGGALRAVLGSRLDGYSGTPVGLGPVVEGSIRLAPWIVLRRRESEAPEVYEFWEEAEARQFHAEVSAQWSECYLLRPADEGVKP